LELLVISRFQRFLNRYMAHKDTIWIYARFEHLPGGMQIVFRLQHPFFFVFDRHVDIISSAYVAGKIGASKAERTWLDWRHRLF